jgi:hypothetical protein
MKFADCSKTWHKQVEFEAAIGLEMCLTPLSWVCIVAYWGYDEMPAPVTILNLYSLINFEHRWKFEQSYLNNLAGLNCDQYLLCLAVLQEYHC